MATSLNYSNSQHHHLLWCFAFAILDDRNHSMPSDLHCRLLLHQSEQVCEKKQKAAKEICQRTQSSRIVHEERYTQQSGSELWNDRVERQIGGESRSLSHREFEKNGLQKDKMRKILLHGMVDHFDPVSAGDNICRGGCLLNSQAPDPNNKLC